MRRQVQTFDWYCISVHLIMYLIIAWPCTTFYFYHSIWVPIVKIDQYNYNYFLALSLDILVVTPMNCCVLPEQIWKQQMLGRCHHETWSPQCWVVVCWNSCHPGQAENCRAKPPPCWFKDKCTMINTDANIEWRQVDKLTARMPHINLQLLALTKIVAEFVKQIFAFDWVVWLCITWE